MGFLSSISSIYSRFMGISFLLLVIFVEVFLWVNGGAIFPDWDATYGSVIQWYLIMTLAFAFFYGFTPLKKDIGQPLSQAVVGALLGAVIMVGFMAVMVAFKFFTPPDLDAGLVFQTILIQVFVVAFSEEVMFRGVVLHLLPHKGKLALFGIVGSALLFSIWHLYAYQIQIFNFDAVVANFGALLIPFILGVVFAVVALKKGLGVPATVAMHSIYNLVILGVFL